ncbi:MAG: shikimate kinase [Balneolaceae bacterium]
MEENKLKGYKGNIYITGFMASGKSTLGACLAKKLAMDFVDLDQVIVEKEEKSIKEIFEVRGEEYFRKKEREYLQILSQMNKRVIALGGGALHDQQMVDQLKSNGLLLFIDTPLSESVDRVHSNLERPVLFNKEGKIKTKQALFDELKTLYSQRVKFYKQAQVSIKSQIYSTTETMAEAAIDKIMQHV